MDAIRNRVDTQVQFWTLLGPLFILVSVTVLLFKISPHWYFPLSALVGIPLCVKWKMQGMAISLLSLFILAAINFGDLELSDRYWHVGLSLTLAFSFIVLTLSLEEAQNLIHKLQTESQSRLDNYLLLDEKWKLAEEALISEKNAAQGVLASATAALAKVTEEKQTFYKIALLAKEELELVRSNHETLLKDIRYKASQINQLKERLETAELTVQEFVDTDPEKKIASLVESLTSLENENNTLKSQNEHLVETIEHIQVDESERKAQLTLIEAECKTLEEEKRLLEIQFKDTESELQAAHLATIEAKKVCESLQIVLQKCEMDKSETDAKITELNAIYNQCAEDREKLKSEIEHSRLKLAILEQEIADLHNRSKTTCHKETELECSPKKNNRKIESMYSQLKEQFEQKCAVLDETRKHLFELSEELSRYKRDNEEATLYMPQEIEMNYQKLLFDLQNDYNELESTFQEEVEMLSSLVKALLKH